jgi:hypothetical protein
MTPVNTVVDEFRSEIVTTICAGHTQPDGLLMFVADFRVTDNPPTEINGS